MSVAPAESSNIVERSKLWITSWAAIAGKWKFGDRIATYTEPSDSAVRAPIGVALGSIKFRDGMIETKITLPRNKQVSAGLVFGFRSLDLQYYAAQLGGWDSAYAIGEYRPDLGWVPITQAGTIDNLDAGVPISLCLQVKGQSVEMVVNDVPVLRSVVNRPIEGSGAGLYAFYDGPIEFRDTAIIGTTPKIFVIMPFSEPFESLYREVIKPVADEMGFAITRVDEITGPGIILDDIQQQIEDSHAVVAEVSTHNPNVFYELGYAHALKKPAILLVRREDAAKMPFDIRGYRAIFYDDSIGGKKVVERKLSQHLSAIRKS
jgi:hypothetical protein